MSAPNPVPDVPQDTEPEYLGQRLSEALARDPRVGELGLEVVVLDAGRAVVTGAVTTDLRRDGVAAVLAEVMPDLEVDNQITVVGSGQPLVERVQ